MFRLLIVDDEKIVRDAVTFILEKEFKGVIEADTAKTGTEAIEKCNYFNPDIVLMDIRMPGINGIDAIKEIKGNRPNIVFIIVSAYEQFEFAKEALKLSVSDYILKPIIKKNLVHSLENVINNLEESRGKRLRELENLERYQNVIPFLEQGFIYSILLGEINKNKIDKYKEILGIDKAGGYIMVLESEEKGDTITFDEKLEIDARESYYQTFKDALKYKCQCLIGPAMLNRSVAFIASDFEPAKAATVDAYKIAAYVNEKLNSFSNNLRFRIGIGSYKSLENIAVSYEEALRASSYCKGKGIVHFKDLAVESDSFTEYPKDQEKRLIEMIIHTDKEGVFEAFKQIYQWINLNYKNSFELGKWKIVELMIIISRTVSEFGIDDKNKNYLFELNNINDYLMLENWCRERVIYLLNTINSLQEKKTKRIILRSKNFINTNFNTEITLDDVSKEVCVTPHYFSRLFKEETGENFIDYLTKIRIEKAKELMKNTDFSIKEISFKIGYSDPNYLSYLFKKIEKVTPSEYIKNFNKG